ncbi:Outer envelope pore protein 24 [Hibiscus syriacus]|uniref:Outer envelope pore protein 24 n=1 Tax=Hibiscus syriacus TaxID=106335 RepID=A0A6A2YBP3_HIBSY|nr:Outer envelope pore protein 24 [Hibiscus syriacus]
MKASMKGRYTNDKSIGAVTLSVNAGDAKLRASMTDATVFKGPSLNGLALAVEKPGFFIIDYDDFRFQFMNSVKVAEKPLNLTYIHSRGDNRTVVDGSLAFDSANKLSANYMLGTRNFKLKYSYVHGGVTTLEPCYDFGKNAWDFAISRRVYDDVFKATYLTLSKDLALEWSRNSKFNGTFKVDDINTELREFLDEYTVVTGKQWILLKRGPFIVFLHCQIALVETDLIPLLVEEKKSEE